MAHLAYKEYLSLFNRPSRLKKAKILLAFGTLVLVGIISALFYLNSKTAPYEAKKTYLETAARSFTLTKQANNDLFESFKIAGAKADVVGAVKETTPSSAGYSSSLDDLNRTRNQIESARKNLQLEREILLRKKVPDDYITLNSSLLKYFGETETVLSGLEKNYGFAANILTASGEVFYLPVLSNEGLWENPNKDEIVNYYQKIKVDADKTLANLARLDTPDKFRPYLESQTAYLETVVKAADTVILVLLGEEEQDPEKSSKIEKAYQILSQNKVENQKLQERILDEKAKIFDLKENFELFAPVNLSQNSLEEQIKAEISSLESESSTDLSKFQIPSFGGFTKLAKNLLQ